MNESLSRRDWLKAAGIVAVGGMLGAASSALAAQSAGAASAGRKRALRFAHLTDIHVQPELKASEGMAACLKHVQAQKDKPEFILTGGDLVMDSFEHDEARTKLQWEIFTKVLKEENGLPVVHTLGNHDVWGWNKKKSGTTGEEPRWGKKWACEMLGLAKPYQSVERGGWRLIVLDSVFPKDEGYVGRLDDEQMQWLKDELAKTPAKTPVMVVSHIPILTACLLTSGKSDDKRTEHKVGGGGMHLDIVELKNLFLKHRNVKLCLSGHLHLDERIDYNGVTYLCNGAVSGAWWKGKNQECDAGYALMDLYDDGSFERTYVNYGWKAAT